MRLWTEMLVGVGVGALASCRYTERLQVGIRSGADYGLDATQTGFGWIR